MSTPVGWLCAATVPWPKGESPAVATFSASIEGVATTSAAALANPLQPLGSAGWLAAPGNCQTKPRRADPVWETQPTATLKSSQPAPHHRDSAAAPPTQLLASGVPVAKVPNALVEPTPKPTPAIVSPLNNLVVVPADELPLTRGMREAGTEAAAATEAAPGAKPSEATQEFVTDSVSPLQVTAVLGCPKCSATASPTVKPSVKPSVESPVGVEPEPEPVPKLALEPRPGHAHDELLELLGSGTDATTATLLNLWLKAQLTKKEAKTALPETISWTEARWVRAIVGDTIAGMACHILAATLTGFVAGSLAVRRRRKKELREVARQKRVEEDQGAEYVREVQRKNPLKVFIGACLRQEM